MTRIAIFLFFFLLARTGSTQIQMLFGVDSLSFITSPLGVDSLFYWFDANTGVTDSLGGAIANNEGVGTWNDLSGNARHATQTTDTDRPVWKSTGGPGGKACIQWDGTDDFLRTAAHFWGSDDNTIIVVMKFANATRNTVETIIRKGETASNDRQFNLQGQNTAASYVLQMIPYKDGGVTNINTYAGSAKSTAFRSIVHTSDGAGTISLYIDGSSVTYTNTTGGTGDHTIFNSSASRTGIGVANPGGTPANFLQGSISEIIVYSKALTATERAAIELYLNKKYDLY